MLNVREVHGGGIEKGHCRAWETDTVVRLSVWNGDTLYSAHVASLTPDQARYIADKLCHLANRVEKANG